MLVRQKPLDRFDAIKALGAERNSGNKPSTVLQRSNEMQVCSVRQPVPQVLTNGGCPALRGDYLTAGSISLSGECPGGNREDHGAGIDFGAPEYLCDSRAQTGANRESTDPIDGRPDPSGQPCQVVPLQALHSHVDIRDCDAGIPSRVPARPDHRDSHRPPGYASSSGRVAWHRFSLRLISRKDSERSITWEVRRKASGDAWDASPSQLVRPAANCR
ncbi:hypothetical protein SAMN05216196_11316 [Lutimaribacter pacificus]|uniref:Uncharacterized protein n=1 Tax=Lutimaribacter pacificus TaxID=391948 RepID=A0A1H0NFI3_9RHOB|nr:hypothetical protein SAMN05216196_11316 [Lutimaribacter pacificus]SHK89916.1 hypothetical protein SAMN05444142_11266 [Lutimaribacter pacificus]